MAFADPQSVTVVGGAVSLPRTSSGVNSGTFQSSDANTKLSVASTYGKRTRRTARLDLRKIAADPLSTAYNAQYSMSAYIVIDVPTLGYTTADEVTNVAGLLTWMTATSNANLTKLLGGES